MRQNHPKMGFGGILDRLEAISIPSISISKGIKNKNFDRFWATRCRPLSPDWLATCPIRGLATCLKAKLPPPFWGETTPPLLGRDCDFGAKMPPFWGEIAILGRNYPPFGARLRFWGETTPLLGRFCDFRWGVFCDFRWGETTPPLWGVFAIFAGAFLRFSLGRNYPPPFGAFLRFCD